MSFKEFSELNHIVFYDGECGVCSTTVQLILKKRKREFYFLPLQTTEASDFLKKFNIEVEMNTLYFYKNGKVLDQSTAVIHIAKYLKGAYPLFFYVGILIPKFIRDLFYKLVSKNRFRFTPKSCVLPKPEDQKYFLAK